MQIETRHIEGGYEATGWLVACGEQAWREPQTLISVNGTPTVRISGDRFDLAVDEPVILSTGRPGYRSISGHGMPEGLTHEQAVTWWLDKLAMVQWRVA